MLLSAHEKYMPRQHISPASYTSTVTPAAGIDMKGFEDALVVLDVGTLGGTSPTLDVKLQDSADNSTFADIEDDSGTDLAVFTQVTGANDENLYVGRIKCSNFRRYLRAIGTIGGTNPTVEFAVQIVPVDPKYSDLVAQSNTLAFNLTGDERSPIG